MTINKSESIKNVGAALVKFHEICPPIIKDAVNPFLKNKYASLEGILSTVKEPLVKSGLSIVQLPIGEFGLSTMLLHTSGEWIEAVSEMKPVKDSPQDRGGVITYQRRYAIGAVLSLQIDSDDDANASSGVTQEKKTNGVEKDDKPWLNEKTDAFTKAVLAVKNGTVTIDQIEKKYKLSKAIKGILEAAQESVVPAA